MVFPSTSSPEVSRRVGNPATYAASEIDCRVITPLLLYSRVHPLSKHLFFHISCNIFIAAIRNCLLFAYRAPGEIDR
jgi:hypothetical protein